jgi:hypothetical protein
MGFDPGETAAISAMDRSGIIAKIQDPARTVRPDASPAQHGAKQEARI